MFDNNGHTMILNQNGRLQIYIWAQGAKLKLETSSNGWVIEELEEAQKDERRIADSLKIPAHGLK